MRVFVAGATGVIGSRLVPGLVAAGHQVVGTTRSAARLDSVEGQDAKLVVVDLLDEEAVHRAVREAEADVIIHQATALSGPPNLRRFDRYTAATNALRTTGTRHLLSAARELGVRRFVAQSFTGWPNERAGGPVKDESDPLDPAPPPTARAALDAIRELESAVTDAPSLQGLVLRYGFLYGKATAIGDGGSMLELVRRRRFPMVGAGTGVWSFLHIDDAVAVTVASVDASTAGVYNIVDDEPAPVAEWLPYLAESVGAKRPVRLPVWLVRPLVGEQGVSFMTSIRGSSNAKARRELALELRYPSWRTGFRGGL